MFQTVLVPNNDITPNKPVFSGGHVNLTLVNWEESYYLELQSNGGIERDVNHRSQAGLRK